MRVIKEEDAGSVSVGSHSGGGRRRGALSNW